MGLLVRHRKILVSLVALALIVVLIGYMSRERESISGPERVLTESVRPVNAVLYRIFSFVGGTVENIMSLGRLRQENMLLRKQVAEQQRLIAQLYEQADENARLREILGLPLLREVRTVTCRVIGRSPDNWFKTLLVDKGEISGISKDMCVVTPQGLVGRITRTTVTTSTVLLLSDPDSGVGALVMRSREAGVVVGGVGRSSRLHMRLFSQNPDVRVGDVVITSGLGKVFPKGIPVGYVTGVRDEEYGLVRVAEISPLANLDSVEEVIVILDRPQEIGGLNTARTAGEETPVSPGSRAGPELR